MGKNKHHQNKRKLKRESLNSSCLFVSDNQYGIPLMRRDIVSPTPKLLVPYRTRVSDEEELTTTAVHFFLDDYRFESVWNRPEHALDVFGPYQTVLSPDFSLYRDWPLALQLWNTYRSRWCGAYWQLNGLQVIPTISWSTASSYDFCFLGIPDRSLVAIATVGVNLGDPTEYHLFMAGFEEMLNQINPPTVICYGSAPKACHGLVNIETHPTHWQKIKRNDSASEVGYGW